MTNKSYTLQELAETLEVPFEGDPQFQITGVADLESATASQLTYCSRPKFYNALKTTPSQVILIKPDAPRPEEKHFLICSHPDWAFQKAFSLFNPPLCITAFEGTHPTAVIHETATLGSNITIGPYAVIDADVTIGDNTFIGAQTYIGPNTKIGSNTSIFPNVTIREQCTIGNHVSIQGGTVIGSPGYGFAQDPRGRHLRLTHVGSVIIEDDVEIGANTIVDRGRFTNTLIKRGTKIDNLVYIGHNTTIGEDNIIIGQSAVAGSSTTGNHVMIGGQTGVSDNVTITDQCLIAARSGVNKSLHKPGMYGGSPILPADKWRRSTIILAQLDTIFKKIKPFIKEQSDS